MKTGKCRYCRFYSPKEDINRHRLKIGYCDCPTRYFTVRKIKSRNAAACVSFERRAYGDSV